MKHVEVALCAAVYWKYTQYSSKKKLFGGPCFPSVFCFSVTNTAIFHCILPVKWQYENSPPDQTKKQQKKKIITKITKLNNKINRRQ